MVKRLLGFVMLIGVVALLLQWVSLRQSEPEPEKKVDIQVAEAPQETPKEAPAPEPSDPPAAELPPPEPPAPADKPPEPPEPPMPAATEPAPETSPAAVNPPVEPESSPAPADEQSPSDPSATEREDTSPEPESSAPAPVTTGQEPEAPPVSEEKKPPPEPEPLAPAASEETTVEERMIPDEEFVAVEQAQGRIDERTDAQRRHQNQDGWYGWGVLADYADPDRAARLLGGAAVVQREGSFFALRESSGGRVAARPIANVSAAYGSIALRGHGSAFRQRLRRALSAGQLLGRENDYKLWYLFPRREATHLGNKVVRVFECHVRESGLSGVAADRFREEAKLRGAVLALRRANGGRLGIYLPRYFQTGEGQVPVAKACRALDEESRRLGS